MPYLRARFQVVGAGGTWDPGTVTWRESNAPNHEHFISNPILFFHGDESRSETEELQGLEPRPPASSVSTGSPRQPLCSITTDAWGDFNSIVDFLLILAGIRESGWNLHLRSASPLPDGKMYFLKRVTRISRIPAIDESTKCYSTFPDLQLTYT